MVGRSSKETSARRHQKQNRKERFQAVIRSSGFKQSERRKQANIARAKFEEWACVWPASKSTATERRTGGFLMESEENVQNM